MDRRLDALSVTWVFYASTMTPLLVIAVVEPLLSARLASFARDGGTPGAVEDALFDALNWWVRELVPLAILAVALAPLLTLAAAWLFAHRSEHPVRVRSIAPWLVLQLVSSGASISLLASEVTNVTMSLALFWSGTVSQAIVIALSYRAQAWLNRRGASRVPAWAVLWTGIVLQGLWVWPGAVVAAVPWAASRSRRTESPDAP